MQRSQAQGWQQEVWIPRGVSDVTGTWDKGQWVQAVLMVKSRETVWEGRTEMPVRTEQVITHPQSSFHGQGVQLLWDVLWLNSIPTKAHSSSKSVAGGAGTCWI